ncbi:RNA modification enzyme, MiaB family [Elusimicrobium minutum Pei191]|uniref:Ribosomal protein uS12 methylthiotransferase RimO n=1 Tax=Elusimicrobium minutum (strain Pei191) TaxID=445932 RepID=RIMO_ELUMP|nr:30S ribosomal protein S12 methylthiotransferase RimO [Elusimicrobium minutum]B2KB59.1 RecName: Full=Ribosomal protein uS12 methylthiotransferase RimO; Short=uS12 MTTase; Short=uS12 methylthiotransferase; AltName: Full=Ribosomal protein uS12 (aspartate-C(3))-methylthiotransferase; AltName: Full=Ribosome maturation factor RimO [Elusimicrobium minutum Pei191]ACC97818.1 RNA modification enzyme, MiaB family [Elusimicrobium minutum Pei191]
MAKIFTISLGCSKNLTDTEEMLGILNHKKHYLVADESEADTILINTCAFIKPAREEADREIKRASKLKAQGKIEKLIVAGCLTQKEGKSLPSKYPLVDAFIGLKGIEKIDNVIKRPKHSFCPAPDYIKAPDFKLQLTAPHSAYLKVADGCNNRCAYCTIPAIRGPFRSKSMEDIVAEAKAMEKNGVKEISLIAQDTTAYGQDIFGKPSLVKLLKKLVKIKGIEWFRIMYAYPETVTKDLLDFIACEPKICRYLDMPLQHISAPVLKAMNRRSTEDEVRAKIKLIRQIVPGMSLRTNFIAGFPGETAEDFEKLKKFIAEAKFNNVGVFAYSKEDGTPAAVMKRQVAEKIKKQRVEELVSAQSRVIDSINRKLKGKTVKVLLDNLFCGRSESDSPDIDGRVEVKGNKKYKAGDFVKVKITSAKGYNRTGKII